MDSLAGQTPRSCDDGQLSAAEKDIPPARTGVPDLPVTHARDEDQRLGGARVVEIADAETGQFFRSTGQLELFGVCHHSKQTSDRPLGVVFCHPIGEEKQKTHRILTRFSRYLGDCGISSFRFDAFGFGESDGNNGDACLSSMVASTRDAIRYFRSMTGIQHLALFGVRLGATVAALTAKAESDVTDLMLVSPVIDGEAYFASLLRAQQMSFLTQGRKAVSKNEMLDELAISGFLELEGELFSRHMLEEIRAVNVAQLIGESSGRVIVSSVASNRKDAESCGELVAAMDKAGFQARQINTEPRDFWSGKVLYEGYYPESLFNTFAQWLTSRETN